MALAGLLQQSLAAATFIGQAQLKLVASLESEAYESCFLSGLRS